MSTRETERGKEHWTIFHSLHTALKEENMRKKEKIKNRSFGGLVLSLIGGIFILVNLMTLNFASQPFPINLMVVSGILVIITALFMYLDSGHHAFWGAIVLSSSSLSYFAVCFTAIGWQMILGALAFVLGVSGGSLGIFSKKEVTTDGTLD